MCAYETVLLSRISISALLVKVKTEDLGFCV